MPAASSRPARPALTHLRYLPHRWSRRWSWSSRTTLVGAVVGACLAGGVSYAAAGWTLGASDHASAGSAAAPVTNLTITAVASPTRFPADLLYSGATGAVIATIANPNRFPVTITAVQLPSDARFAAGFTDPSLATARVGCSAVTPRGLTWAHATSTTASMHTLISPFTVAAGSRVSVTFPNAAVMAMAALPACANSYFEKPPLAGLIATAAPPGLAHPSVITTDGWTR